MKRALRHLFSPHGRVGRTDWWLSMAVLLALLFQVNFAAGFLTGTYYCAKAQSDSYYAILCPGSDFYRGTNPITWWVEYLSLAVLIWCTFAISTKRFHDHGRSAWWHLLNLIPIIGGLIWLAMLGFFKGEDAPNKYGEG